MFRRTLVLLITLASFMSAAPLAAEKIALPSGVTMHYVTAGEASAPPLILLHGLGDTNRSWSFVVPELAKTHRVYALDQRGHGATSAPPCCYGLADLAYDVTSFMDAMKIERASIAGHSLGSFVAQYLASHEPSRVTKLVLLGSSDTTTGTDVIEWLWAQTTTFGERVPPAFIDEWQSNPTPVEETFIAKVKAETAEVRPHVWRGIASTLRTDDQTPFLSAVEAPVLILWGEKDAAFPRERQKALRRVIPRARFIEYPRVGHNLHWELPAQIAKDLGAFLAGR